MAGLTLSSADLRAMRTAMDAATSTNESAVGLPASAAQALRELIRCDEFDVTGQDWTLSGHYFNQTIIDEGSEGHSMTAQRLDGHPVQLFWQYFWGMPCSQPERTGEYGEVTKLSDVVSDRQMRSGRTWPRPTGQARQRRPASG